jgi:uncharacterized membrane protein YagU involved in acid resistance
MNTISNFGCAIGRGLIAGLAGTAAMTVSSTVEMRLRDRAGSSAPADATAKVLGIEGFTDDAAKNRFSTVVHWGYGTGWGVVRAMLGQAGLSPVKATAAHLAAIWGNEAVMLPALDVAPPFWTWGAEEVAIDVFHHIVYATATGIAYEALR